MSQYTRTRPQSLGSNMSVSSLPTLHGRNSEDTLPGDLHDLESQKSTPAPPPAKVPHWQLVKSYTLITDAVLMYPYKGSGTDEDPYLVEFIPDDPRNPMNFPQVKKWFITMTVAFAT